MTPVDTIITCPICDREAQELIPNDACVLEYECEGCRERPTGSPTSGRLFVSVA